MRRVRRTCRFSSLNFAVSDGRSFAVSVIRFRSSMSEDPPDALLPDCRRGRHRRLGPSSSDAETLKEWTLLGKNRMLSYILRRPVFMWSASARTAATTTCRRRRFMGVFPDGPRLTRVVGKGLVWYAAATVLAFLLGRRWPARSLSRGTGAFCRHRVVSLVVPDHASMVRRFHQAWTAATRLNPESPLTRRRGAASG